MSDDGTLPLEILTDLLLRLPVKSLCRFKCVSPSWNSLISDPYFVKTHLNRTNTQNPKNLYLNKIIMSTYQHLHSVDFADVNFADVKPTITKLEFPTMGQHAAVWSSCDGLLLVSQHVHSSLFLLNPSTRECNKLPSPPFVVNPVCRILRSLYGLGYNSCMDDYNIVVMLSSYKTRYTSERDINSTVAVYSLKTNAWSGIQYTNYHLVENSGGVFFNGCIHGLGWRASSKVIVAFDLSVESFREVPLPASFRGSKISFYEVAVFGGCLCLVNRKETEIWMMKEYGVRESWTKSTICSGLRMANLLCLLAEDKFLLRTTGEKLKQFVVYDSQKDTARDMVVCGIPARFSFESTYVESLVSPHHGREIGRQ